jgi:hypothetical protein
MPITFNEAEGFWELANPTKAEKEDLIKGAIEQIRDFFGHETANRILMKSGMFGIEGEFTEGEANANADSFSTGEAGNA